MSFFSCISGKSSTPPTPPPKSKPLPTPVQKKTNDHVKDIKNVNANQAPVAPIKATVAAPPTKAAVTAPTKATVRMATPQEEASANNIKANFLESRKILAQATANLEASRLKDLGLIEKLLGMLPNIERELDANCAEHKIYFNALSNLKDELLATQGRLKQPNADLVKEDLPATASKAAILARTVEIENTIRPLITEQKSTTVEVSRLLKASTQNRDAMLNTINQLTASLEKIRSDLPTSQNIIGDEAKRTQLVADINQLDNKYQFMITQHIRPAIAKQ